MRASAAASPDSAQEPTATTDNCFQREVAACTAAFAMPHRHNYHLMLRLRSGLFVHGKQKTEQKGEGSETKEFENHSCSHSQTPFEYPPCGTSNPFQIYSITESVNCE